MIAYYMLLTLLGLSGVGGIAVTALALLRNADEDIAMFLAGVAIAVAAIGSLAGVAYHGDDKTCIIRPASVVEAP